MENFSLEVYTSIYKSEQASKNVSCLPCSQFQGLFQALGGLKISRIKDWNRGQQQHFFGPFVFVIPSHLVFMKSWLESHCCAKTRENSFSDIFRPFLVVNPNFIAGRKLRQNNDQNNCHQSNYQSAITQQVPASLSHSHKVIILPSGHLIAGLPVLYTQQKNCAWSI